MLLSPVGDTSDGESLGVTSALLSGLDNLNSSMIGNDTDYYSRNVNYIFGKIFPPKRLGKEVI